SLVKSELSSGRSHDAATLKRLSDLLRKTEQTLAACRIEQAIARATRKQVAALGALESRKYDTIALLGGNQSGKSFIGGVMVARQIRDVLPPGSKVWVVSPNDELSVKTPQRYLWELLPHGKLDASYNPRTGFGGKRPMLIYDPRNEQNPNGRNIIVQFKSEAQYINDPDSFESDTVTGLVWVDESIGELCWNAIQPRVLIHNVPIIVTTIPRMEWMFEAFEEPGPNSKVYYDKLLPADNPMMTPEALRRLESSITSEEERQMRLFGNFMFFGGVVYKEFVKEYKPDGHLIRPFPIPDDWPKWRAMDIGMDHPTVCVWGTVAPNGNAYIYREYYSRNTAIAVDAQRIIEMSGDEQYAAATLVDPSAYNITKANEKSVAQQFEEAGVPMRPAVKVGHGRPEWALVNLVKRRLIERSLFVFDTCPGLIAEFRKWKFKRDLLGQPVGDDFEDRNNDGLDALKYWLADSPRFYPPEII